MKRYILSLFILSVVSTASAAGTTDTGSLSVTTGISYINKDIKNNGVKDDMTAREIVIKGNYGLAPNLNLIVKLGLGDLEVGGFQGRLDALYGVGASFKLFKDPEDRVNVFLEGEISRFSSSDSGTDADVTDYHGAFIVKNKAGNITPYGGLKFSETEVDFSGSSSKFKADKHVGIIGGVDYYVNPNVFFNGEVNIFDQDAVHIGVGYKF